MTEKKVIVYPPMYAYGYKENSWDALRHTPGMFKDLHYAMTRQRLDRPKTGIMGKGNALSH